MEKIYNNVTNSSEAPFKERWSLPYKTKNSVP